MILVNENRFYRERPTNELAQSLLGSILTYESPAGLVGGLIVETEAYMGVKDSAAHAYNGKRTKSNEPLYGPAGTVYIYSIHGRYLLDVATQAAEEPQGILIRAIEPTIGEPIMRTNRLRPGFELTNGPGKLMEALGINNKEMNFEIIGEGALKIDLDNKKTPNQVGVSERIGVANQGDWASKPLRYFVAGNPYVSGMKRREMDLQNHGWR